MANKMTKRDYFNQLLALEVVKDNENLVTFIKREIELLDKKNGANRKMTKVQVENEAIRGTITEVLKGSKAMTITDMTKDSRLSAYSNQKLSALVRQLVASGEVVRTEEKKVAYFELSDENAEIDEILAENEENMAE